ncbi:hypothetical protein C8R45DRAFT_527088 [Mycena sanguinolenta]|nr:hypothetical protein C8R45DRAFT_527088 [Mycena sanguinolenta]
MLSASQPKPSLCALSGWPWFLLGLQTLVAIKLVLLPLVLDSMARMHSESSSLRSVSCKAHLVRARSGRGLASCSCIHPPPRMSFGIRPAWGWQVLAPTLATCYSLTESSLSRYLASTSRLYINQSCIHSFLQIAI